MCWEISLNAKACASVPLHSFLSAKNFAERLVCLCVANVVHTPHPSPHPPAMTEMPSFELTYTAEITFW